MAFHKVKKHVPTIAEREAKCVITGERACIFSPSGNVYQGEWLNDLKHGYGTEIKKIDGSIYQGQWELGKHDGYGVYSEWNEEANRCEKSYVGYWKNGQKHGFGKLYHKTTMVYIGDWFQGFKEGLGIMFYENGDIYEGFWRRNMTHGLGILRLANGNKYEGSFENGIVSGKGTFYYNDIGKIYEGLWKKGSPVCGTISDFEKDKAPTPSTHSLPAIRLQDMEGVLKQCEVAYHHKDLKLIPYAKNTAFPEDENLLSQ